MSLLCWIIGHKKSMQVSNDYVGKELVARKEPAWNPQVRI
jgi:hypothetical protein